MDLAHNIPSPLPLFSTAYLPPIDYMAVLSHHTDAAIEIWETYSKQTYRNRCTILSANGLLDLSIPVSRPNGNHTCIADIKISYAEPWNIRHWRAIESAYSSSPYFLYYRDGIERILRQPTTFLIDLNDKLTQHLLSVLKLNTTLSHTTTFKPYSPSASANDTPMDFRQRFSPKSTPIKIVYPSYSQVFDTKFPFQPNLSVIDLLFNLGPESGAYLKKLSC